MIEQAIERTCAELGYTTIKDKQKEVILNFVSGRDVLLHYLLVMARFLCAMDVCLAFSTVRRGVRRTLSSE